MARPLRDRRDLHVTQDVRPMRLLFNAGALHGARPGHWTGRDIAFFSGCRVATVLYCTFSRSIGVAAERRVADAETTELERAAEQPARR
jgi:hypothetical protein